MYQLIADRRRSEQGSNNIGKSHDEDLLSRLMEAQDSDSPINNQEKMSDKQVRDEVMTIFIAGHETTSNALTWTFYLLSQNQDIETKLHNEIDSVLGHSSGNNIGRTPTADDIPKLQYTEKVLRESMRLYPPVWTIGRRVENDYSVGEYTIPAGSSILMSQYVMHHNPRYYKEPYQFNPDRWTEEFKSRLPRFCYFPFGGGIRGCIGEPFAWIEGILIIATIAQKWSMCLLPSHRIKLDPAITLRPKHGMKMKLIQRTE